MPADPAWQRLDGLDDPVLTGLIRRKLAEVRAAAGAAASGWPDAQLVHGDWHIAFFIDRYADGDHGALGQIRLGVDLLLRAEQRWPALRAAILTGTAG